MSDHDLRHDIASDIASELVTVAEILEADGDDATGLGARQAATALVVGELSLSRAMKLLCRYEKLCRYEDLVDAWTSRSQSLMQA